MDFRYDEPNDAHQQLDHSVVMTKHGHAVYLRYAGAWDWSLHNLATGEVEIVDLRKAGINFAPLELGYVNHRHGLSYITRDPRRMWKQGLSYEHIKSLRGEIHEDMLKCSEMNDTLTNVFPSLEDTYRKVVDDAVSVAFHRDFAFNTKDYPNIVLEYKGKNVGKLDNNLDFEVSEEFFYLKEMLQEIANGKG